MNLSRSAANSGGQSVISICRFAGVRRTVCWHLAPEIAHYADSFTMMELLQGKLLLVTHDDDGELIRRRPAGNAFRLLSEQLEGAQSVVRVTLEEHPSTRAAWPWHHERATAVDALGHAHAVEPRDGYLTVPV